jgi:cation:H+ antiporter
VILLTALGAVVVGGLLLAVAADQFVIGAARIALLRRISPLAVGVVIVGFGTSAPELLVSVLAAVAGDTPIAVGNIVGSNIANLTLLLGIGAVLLPLTVASRTVRREAPLTVAATVVFALAVQSGIAIWEGAILLALMAAVIWRVMRTGNSDPLGIEADEFADAGSHNLKTEVGRTLLGLVGTLAGAQLLLSGALDLATLAGLSEGFVGATLVAVGTSLPELVTVVQSARRREGDLILGNLLGSNLFNALAVGGMVGVVGSGAAVGSKLSIVAAGIAVAVAALAWVMMRTGRTVSRLEGGLLVAIYPLIVLALF